MDSSKETAKQYSSYLKLDILSETKPVKENIDFMLTRLEELTSVLSIIKSKNQLCSTTVATRCDLYRPEINKISKKIDTLEEVIAKVSHNIDMLEKHIERAEMYFGISHDNTLQKLFKPFLKKEEKLDQETLSFESIELTSVLDYFVDSKTDNCTLL